MRHRVTMQTGQGRGTAQAAPQSGVRMRRIRPGWVEVRINRKTQTKVFYMRDGEALDLARQIERMLGGLSAKRAEVNNAK
jgi:hypothetical protein